MPIDLSSMIQQIQEEIVRRSTADIPRIQRAIIDSLEYYAHRRTYFNEGVAQWDTTLDKVDYGNETEEGAGLGYPDDMLEVDALYYQQDDALFEPIALRPISWIRRTQDAITAQGLPVFWAWHAQRIHFDRRAHRVFQIHIDYMRDLGVPTYSWDGAQWEFFAPDGVTPLPDSFSNEWFTEADDLIRYRAQTRLARWLKDNDDFMRARVLEDEAFQRVKGRSTAYQRPMVRTPSYL